MSFLRETVNLIRETFLTEATVGDVVQEIRDAVSNAAEPEKDGGFTGVWLAGLAKGLEASDSKLNMLLAAARGGRLDPESKEYRDALRTQAALEVLQKYKLVISDRGQFFKNEDRKEALSKVMGYATRESNDNKERKELAKQVRSAEYSSDQDWYDSLPQDQKRAVKILRDLDLKSNALLNKILTMKERKKSYKDLVGYYEMQDSGIIDRLKAADVINPDNTLNMEVINSIEELKSSPQFETRLKFINRSVRDATYKMAADKALGRSAFAKDMAGTPIGQKAQSVVQRIKTDTPGLENIIKSAFSGRKIFKSDLQKLQKMGLADNGGGATDLGKAVYNLLKTGRTPEDIEKTNRGVSYSGFRPSEDSMVRDRLNQRAADRKDQAASVFKKS